MNATLSGTMRLAMLAGSCAILAAAGCTRTADAPAPAPAPAQAVYVAQLNALNSGVTGSKTTGEAKFEVHGDQLTISVQVTGAPPGITHWQHFHGFTDSRAAACATQDDDVNADGIVDLIETEKASGTTMVPFDNAPAAMDVAHGSYPQASADGSYTYSQTVSLNDLAAAFDKAFPGQQIDLDRRVVYIHGVPEDTQLPATVASLGPIPASVTLPIACGAIARVVK